MKIFIEGGKIKLIITGLILTVFSLSILHVSLRAEPLELLYLLIISVLFCILFIFVITKGGHVIGDRAPTIFFLSIYIVLIFWLGVSKTIPEYRGIIKFEKRQLELIYEGLGNNFDRIQLARLYMNAPDVIERIQPGVHHKGNMIMHEFLKGKISSGEGSDYVEDLYLLAESGFTYSSKGYAYNWYKNAFEFGKKDALKRYEERLLKHGILKEKLLKKQGYLDLAPRDGLEPPT